MRTVHEPEQIKGAPNDPATNGKKPPSKLKMSNGALFSGRLPPGEPGPTQDEDGNPVAPSGSNENIEYMPAHHPITGQPGFMITYPPDIHFTAWESSIPADQLVRLLRRQVHWAQKEGSALKGELAELERIRTEEWGLKDILLEGVLEAELSRAEKDGLLRDVDERVLQQMEADVEPAKRLEWTGGTPPWRRRPRPTRLADTVVADAVTPGGSAEERTPSPPPTGKSGGFDGDADPYDNYLEARMAEYEARERMRSEQNTPLKSREQASELEEAARDKARDQRADEADAVGALIGMSGS